MTAGGMADAAAVFLLALAALVCVLSSLGFLVMKDFYARLHYLAPPAIVATAAIAAAILLAEGIGAAAVKAFLVLLVMAISNPVLTHAAARAHYLREARGKEEKGHTR